MQNIIRVKPLQWDENLVAEGVFCIYKIREGHNVFVLTTHDKETNEMTGWSALEGSLSSVKAAADRANAQSVLDYLNNEGK